MVISFCKIIYRWNQCYILNYANYEENINWICFCLSITSCSLDTIPTSQYVEDNFWKTPEQIEAGLVACYSTMYNVYMYGSNLIFSETGTPNAYNYNGTYGWRVIGDGSVNSINSDIVNGKWGACYQGIGRCNTFIAGAPSFVISEEDKRRW